MTRNEFNDHFGSEIRPDIVKISGVRAPTLVTSSQQFAKGQEQAKQTSAITQATAATSNLIAPPERMDEFQEMHGEFKIERGFSGMEKAATFSVSNPHKPRGSDFFQYTVVGHDRLGRFEIFRRYSDFAVLRELFVDRFPGMYVPPVPPK